jgi:hypothetical protein
MLNFKQYLSEASSAKKHPEELAIEAKIKEWRAKIASEKVSTYSSWYPPFGKYKIVPYKGGGYGVEHLSENLKLYEWMFENGELPFKFISCNTIDVYGINAMKRFKNFPDIILNNGHKTISDRRHYSFGVNSVMNGPNITSLEGVPRHINGAADFSHFKNLSFSNVHTHIDYIDGIKFPYPYKGPVLGFLKIASLTSITDHGEKWQQILNKHLASEKRSILACQQDLMKANLLEYAKI